MCFFILNGYCPDRPYQEYLVQILSGLNTVHAADLVHRGTVLIIFDR